MKSENFFPDYHEHDDFQPAMLALSHFTMQWNWAEHNFNVLLWHYAGDMVSGAMFTAALGNQSRAEALLALVKKNESDKEIRDITAFAVKAFDLINSNRNSLLHAHSITLGEDGVKSKPRWIRASKNPKSLHVYCQADIEDVTQNLEAACLLAIMLGELLGYKVSGGKHRPSISKFSLPRNLKPIPILLEDHGISDTARTKMDE